MENRNLPAGYARVVERPATLIAAGLNVILGVSLAIVVILKIYMLVLTDLTCTGDATTVGNIIRCTSMLGLAAAFLAATATVAAARAILVLGAEVWVRVLGLAGAAAFFALMDQYLTGDYNWRLTLATVAVFAISVLAIAFARLGLSARPGAGDSRKTTEDP